MVRAVGAGLVAAVLGLMGCTSSDAVTCGDRTCPAGTVCAQLTAPDELLCATSDQVDACSGMAEGSPCTYGDVTNAWCHDNTCITSVCGNARPDPGEACDDGNTIAGDGTCSADCTSTEICGNHIVDPLLLTADGPTAKEQCDDGNLVSNDGCSSTCQLEVPQWVQLGLRLPDLVSASTAYDAARRKIVLFGGDQLGNGGPDKPNGLTFEWNGNGWGMVPTLVSPASRFQAGIAYDSNRHVTVLFGGQSDDDNTGPLRDLWEYDGSNWHLRPFATGPSARTKFGMAYDPKRKKVVVYGGFGPTLPNGAPASLGDTWEWDGASWTETTNPALGHDPSSRTDFTMAYDPKVGAVILAGGYNDNLNAPSRETWRYDGAWMNLDIGSPPALDSGAALAFDRISGTLVSYGGAPFGGPQVSETWSFDGTSWTDLNQTTPGVLTQATLAADPTAGTMILYGGTATDNVSSNETWIWNGSSWTAAPSASDVPTKRFGAATANDTAHGVAWMYGGEDLHVLKDELWSFDGITWHEHAMGMTRPAPREYASMVYDPVHDELVLFGGSDGSNIVAAETWLWNGTSWRMAGGTQPPARFIADMFFDATLQMVVLSGGFDGDVRSDVWTWDGNAWSPASATAPGAAGACATYEPSRSEAVRFGGLEQGQATLIVHGDTLLWNGMWATVSTPIAPADRFLCSMAYDGASRQSVMFAGLNVGSTRFGDTWTWSGTEWSPMLPLTVPPIRNGTAMFSDPSGAGVAMFGGQQGDASTPNLADTWRFRYISPDQTELCALADVDRDGDGKAGCADEDCWATCAPLCPPGTTCPANAPRCGDSNCDPVETCRSCPGDCECTPVCGDTFCDPGETATSCPGDC